MSRQLASEPKARLMTPEERAAKIDPLAPRDPQKDQEMIQEAILNYAFQGMDPNRPAPDSEEFLNENQPIIVEAIEFD